MSSDIKIEVPETITAPAQAASRFVDRAPELVTIMAITFGFLYYLHAREAAHLEEWKRNEKLTEARVQACHDIQERSIVVMRELGEALKSHDIAFTKLDINIGILNDTLDEVRRDIKNGENP
jgi:hypothetical protein